MKTAVIGTVTGTTTDVTFRKTDMLIAMTGQAIDLTGHLPKREKSELTKSVKITSMPTAMAMSSARLTRAGSKRIRAAGQKLTAVDRVPVVLT